MGGKVKLVEKVGPVIGVLGIVVPGKVVGVRVTRVVEFDEMVVLGGSNVGVNVIPPVEVGVRVISSVEVGVIRGGLDVVVTAGGVKAQMRGGHFGPSHGFLRTITVVIEGYHIVKVDVTVTVVGGGGGDL